MTIIGCMFYVTLGVFLGFMCWLVSDIVEAVESKIKLKKTAATKTITAKTTVTTNREYYIHGGIVYDPNGNPI